MTNTQPIAEVNLQDRWELYRVLGESGRLKLLALIAEEELSVGELAELLSDSQSNTSRHIAQLKRANLARVRKQGTRVMVSLEEHARQDVVVSDAIGGGHAGLASAGLTTTELKKRVAALLDARTAPARAFFAEAQTTAADQLGGELPAYLWLLGQMARHAPDSVFAHLAVDIGTGSGVLIDALAPFVNQVVAIDRESAQLQRAYERVLKRGYSNVELLEADAFDVEFRKHISKLGGADLVFASRVLHHASRPSHALTALATLVAPGGTLVVIDYAEHDDAAMQSQYADVWLGFAGDQLRRFALEAGLVEPRILAVPHELLGAEGLADGHLPWQALVAEKPVSKNKKT